MNDTLKLNDGDNCSNLQNDENNQKLTYGKLICDARYFFPGITVFMAEISWMHQESILAYRLTEKNLTTMQIGLFFAIYPVAYILYCGLLSQLISRKIEKRVILILASLTNLVTFALIGPSLLLGFPDSILLMCLG